MDSVGVYGSKYPGRSSPASEDAPMNAGRVCRRRALYVLALLAVAGLSVRPAEMACPMSVGCGVLAAAVNGGNMSALQWGQSNACCPSCVVASAGAQNGWELCCRVALAGGARLDGIAASRGAAMDVSTAKLSLRLRRGLCLSRQDASGSTRSESTSRFIDARLLERAA